MLSEEQLHLIEQQCDAAYRQVKEPSTAVQHVRVLLEEVRRLRAENERLRGCANCRHAIPTELPGFVRCEVYCHIVALPCLTWEAAQ